MWNYLPIFPEWYGCRSTDAGSETLPTSSRRPAIRLNGESWSSEIRRWFVLMFSDYLERWELTPDGDPIVTPTSRLLPVVRSGSPAMLKLAVHPEEQRGNRLMTQWDGDGAARVLMHAGDAILMERAAPGTLLADLARNG